MSAEDLAMTHLVRALPRTPMAQRIADKRVPFTRVPPALTTRPYGAASSIALAWRAVLAVAYAVDCLELPATLAILVRGTLAARLLARAPANVFLRGSVSGFNAKRDVRVFAGVPVSESSRVNGRLRRCEVLSGVG